MIRLFAVALTATFALAPAAHSQSYDADAGYDPDASYGAEPVYAAPANYGTPGRVVLGHGRLTNNDLLGDLDDRWQTGSVSSSRVVGRNWSGMLPDRPFDILEYRLSGQIIAPENMRTPDPEDRPWAGALSLGLHTHFMRGPVEMSMGGDLVVTGPQTGLGDLQTFVHDAIGEQPASRSVLSNQIENGVHPTLVLEAANSIPMGGQSVLRPFGEARAGVETLVRAGFDLTIGSVGQGELLVRDSVTGQRYRAVTDSVPGFSFVMGGDIAYVDSSVFLPSGHGYDLSNTRTRARAGLHWQGQSNAMFYGFTWMSKEFDTQPEGQVLGSVRLDLRF